MKNIPQERVLESLNWNCLTTPRSGSFLHDMVELCEKVNDELFYELIPIRLVAYLEDVLRVKYEFVLRQPGQLKDVFGRNKKIFSIDSGKLIEGSLPLSLQIAYSLGCNNVNEICGNIEDITGSDINSIGRAKLGNDSWGELRKSIDGLFKTRHRLCHESGVGVRISKDCARTWIQDVGALLKVIDCAIVNTVYKDYHVFKEGEELDNDIDSRLDNSIKEAQRLLDESEKTLDRILQLSTDSNQYPGSKPNLDYIPKWKEYRNLRVDADNVFPIGSKQNVLFALREKLLYNESLINEIKLQYRDFLNYIILFHKIE